jgi:hypothetical protein
MSKLKSNRSGIVVLEGTKICNQCNVEKIIADNYYASNLSKCKICVKENAKKTVANDPGHKKEMDKKWREENKEHKLKNDKKWREENSERKKANDTRYRELHKDDPVHIEMMKNSRAKWKEANYEKWISKPENKIIETTRVRIRTAIKKVLNGIKSDRSTKLLGCSPEFYVKWFRYQFDSFMSFENYGSYWEIDHVVPCSKFNLLLENDQKTCFNWTNTRPLKKQLIDQKMML